MTAPAVRAVLFDFGGVISESPFEAFWAFERSRKLPEGFLQHINRSNPDSNAWARFERGEITPDEFDAAFAAESGAVGFEVRGLDVIELLYGPVRPCMTRAVARCKPHFLTACLTNNVQCSSCVSTRAGEWAAAIALFDQVIESSMIGARKPELRFFELACKRLAIEPREAVFLDDLGTNLKPARAMGMRTIKVAGAAQALAELESLLGIQLL
ncbi:MAG: HAD-IA family hydrolase [Burkholderiales bacterium]